MLLVDQMVVRNEPKGALKVPPICKSITPLTVRWHLKVLSVLGAVNVNEH